MLSRLATLVVITLALSCSVKAEDLQIDSREYKLRLDPNAFAGPPSDAIANRFWSEKLKPLIETTLDKRENGKVRSKKSFALDEEDTCGSGTLSSAFSGIFALRSVSGSTSLADGKMTKHGR